MKNLAPQVGFEPTTLRLTAEWLVAAYRVKQKVYTFIMPIFEEIGETLGGPGSQPAERSGLAATAIGRIPARVV